MLDNTCNLMCYICGTGNSSKWAAAKPILNDLQDFSSNTGWYNKVGTSKIYAEQLKRVLTILTTKTPITS